VNNSTAERAFALVGPGSAGTTIARALVRRGWRATAVAGRSPDARSTREVAARLGCPAVATARAGARAELVVVATPDAEIERAGASLAPSLEFGALVVHLAGSRGLDALAPVASHRADVALGVLHPLQSLPDPDVGLSRLAGSWASVAGDPAVADLARDLGLRPFTVADEHRALYHATAAVASNHLVVLLGQVERLAAACGVPFEAFLPLARGSLDNVVALGPRTALTGPVARGDTRTVERHLDALPVAERASYRAAAGAALTMADHDGHPLRALLGEVVA
jgi:predicted short-subunit dehydrogenase-like oxidoreductase (DUF2520 family)